MSETYRIHRIKENWGIIIAIIFIASTLRAPLTSVGPVVSEITKVLQVSDSVAGSLITIPLLIFAIVSPLVSKVTAHLSVSRTILLSTLLLSVALIIRVIGDINIFLLGTVLLGIGIAFGNVLLPSFVKWYFPTQIGVATGIYSATMHFTAGIGGGLSFPLSTISPLSFRISLSVWFVLAIIAIILWLPKAVHVFHIEKATKQQSPTTSHCHKNVFKSKLSWMIAITMGFQSMIVYTVVAWVPSILMDRGIDPSTAGYLFMINQFAQVPMTFTFPIIADKLKDQRILVFIVSFLFLVGFGLLFTHSFILLVIGIIVSGLAMGAYFSLCMTFFSIRARTSDGSVSLSGFGQSLGYFIGAMGPICVGFTYDVSGGWQIGITSLLVMSLLFAVFGYFAAENKVIEDE
ncbi:MFS transporter [Staphylococcus gallinarum]|uniref:CynX/NimT family MFS transporter n=1 Tax=Staphylococcus gallinarum TaxID=1293 RepID=UPI00227EFB0A|nr:MFS transporter [Staphylococcus gallinarum]MDN6414053.1 MFS transporter [Staphylococcus gallinarum]